MSAKHQVSIKLVGNMCVLYLVTAYASSLMIFLPPADLYHFFRLFRGTAHFMSGSRQLFLFRLGRSFHINFFLKTKTIFKYSQRESNRQHPSLHSAKHQSKGKVRQNITHGPWLMGSAAYICPRLLQRVTSTRSPFSCHAQLLWSVVQEARLLQSCEAAAKKKKHSPHQGFISSVTGRKSTALSFSYFLKTRICPVCLQSPMDCCGRRQHGLTMLNA